MAMAAALSVACMGSVPAFIVKAVAGIVFDAVKPVPLTVIA
jgi:hypothetical protein